MQYSALGCAFSDFPLHSTKAMSKLEAQKYLLDYAKEFDLDSKVKLNTEVVDIRRHIDYDESGKWTIKYKQ
jgi:cation diffusion facilitator CzcD-associated flavoprotein CzcO